MPVPTRINSKVSLVLSQTSGGGTNYIVETQGGIIYCFFINLNTDPTFCKSLDGGMTWGTETVLKNCSCTQLSVWYDRWSGINADLIHVAYTDSGSDDVFYRNINAANSDTLSTEYTVFAGSSTANGGVISISRMRGGNLIIVGSIDAATEIYSRKSTDVGANWSDISAGYESGGTADQCIVMPGWDADNQDAMMFYYDRSATEISVKYYDDSANSWSETSIATSISLPDHTSTTLGHMNAAVDLTNSQNLLVFWTAIDTANADLRCFKVTQSAQTETANNVVLNSTDDQGFCGISICPIGCLYVFYLGKSNGSETYNYQAELYYKKSTDGGATWGLETQLPPNISFLQVAIVSSIPIWFVNRINGAYFMYIGTQNAVHYSAPLAIPRTTYQLGI